MEIFGLGHDFVQRGEFANAYERYSEAARKFARQGDLNNAAVASAYGSVMQVGQRMSDPSAYHFAAQSLRNLGPTTIKLGLREISAATLATEADLLAGELEVRALQPTNPDQYRQKAQVLQNLAMRFRSELGGQVLVLPELFHQGTVQGEAKALPLAAEAEENLGDSKLSDNPRAAAEHYQSARLWWTQAGFSGRADQAAIRVRAYGRAAKCWFCGREVSGEGIHFIPMPSELTEVVRRSGAETALPTFDSSSNAIYACKGCHGAVYKLADSLAVRRMQELEVRVTAQINELRSQISDLGRQLTISNQGRR